MYILVQNSYNTSTGSAEVVGSCSEDPSAKPISWQSLSVTISMPLEQGIWPKFLLILTYKVPLTHQLPHHKNICEFFFPPSYCGSDTLSLHSGSISTFLVGEKEQQQKKVLNAKRQVLKLQTNIGNTLLCIYLGQNINSIGKMFSGWEVTEALEQGYLKGSEEHQ